MRAGARLFFVTLLTFNRVLCDYEFDKQLYQLANEIVQKYFHRFICVTHITDKPYLNFHVTPKGDQPILLTDFFTSENCTTGKRNCTEEMEFLLYRTYVQGCGGYVIQVERAKRDQLVKRLLKAYAKSPTNRYNDKRYLFLPSDENDTDISIIDSPEMFFMHNLLFVTSKTSTAGSNSTTYNFELHTHNILHGEKYDVLGIKHEVVANWTSAAGFSGEDDLYPDKTQNAHRKKMVLSLIHYVPYALVIDEGDHTAYDGLETRMAYEFLDIVNATWEAKIFPGMWGALFENNGTGNGILGAVLDHSADMGFAAVYQWRCEAVMCSYPYVFVTVTCLVPKPQLVAGWLTIVLSFTPETWYSFIVAYVISSTFVFFVYSVLEHMKAADGSRHPGHGMILFDSFYITFRLQLEQIPKMAYKKTPLALYTKWLTIYYFFVAVVWSGGIASILTVPRYEKPINEVHELVAQYPKIEWGANHDVWVMPIEQSTIPDQLFMAKKFVVNDDATLVKRAKNRTFAFFMERLPNGHYGFNDYINEETVPYLRLMEGYVHTANCVIVSPEGWPFMQRLDRMIRLMFETGIIQKLEYQISIEKINNRLQLMIKASTDKPVDRTTSLQVRHIEGPIYIYIIGASFSIGVFSLELFTYFIHSKCANKTTKVKKLS